MPQSTPGLGVGSRSTADLPWTGACLQQSIFAEGGAAHDLLEEEVHAAEHPPVPRLALVAVEVPAGHAHPTRRRRAVTPGGERKRRGGSFLRLTSALAARLAFGPNPLALSF